MSHNELVAEVDAIGRKNAHQIGMAGVVKEGWPSHIQLAEEFTTSMMAWLPRKDVLFWWKWTPVDRVKR
jgi:hypothetical protein